MNEYIDKELIVCPYCDVTLRVPKTQQTLKITCPSCTSVFFHNLPKRRPSIRKRIIGGAAIISAIVIVALLNVNDRSRTLKSTGQVATEEVPSNWISISYEGLVDKTLFTHSGETVGAVISQISLYNDEFKGLVQPYLEPFSILCNDVMLTINGPDTLPFVNIVSHYPIGSEQPAWAALFREGHYQLYYSPSKIRVFLKGTNAKQSFENYKSVVRHAVRDAISSEGIRIDSVEVFVFTNDYASTTIRLNTIPASYAARDLDLEARNRSIDLSSIGEFLNEGVILEAIEVDQNNDLFFYGKAAKNQTLAGKPLSIADLAVVYRSVFHYGNNSPYISLDKHEDNRFAKVNFGGHLEDTHTGHVVLEADKLFKAISTGIDPNTHRVIRDRITRAVPDFLTEDERSLLETSGTKHTQIRYWFYPDSIGTVTDGSIGAIFTNQFLADVERMDMPLNVSSATRRTISHLNNYFGQYERAFETFKELSTVGRLMALVNWLKGLNVSEGVELDELLSVRLPAFRTPNETKKMLAVTAAAYPKSYRLAETDVRDHSKVYYISYLMENCAPTSSDTQFLQLAVDYFDNLDADELAPPQYNNTYFVADCITSVGGGINLRPKEFRKISHSKSAPMIREITSVKSRLQSAGYVAKAGNWIRSRVAKGGARINAIPVDSWMLEKAADGSAIYRHVPGSRDHLSFGSSKAGEWRSETFINNIKDVVQVSDGGGAIKVQHLGLGISGRGSASKDAKLIVFNR